MNLSRRPLTPREAGEKADLAPPLLETLRKKFPVMSSGFLETITCHEFFKSAVTGLLEMDPTSLSEDDPWLLIVPNLNNQDSVAYWHSGNYGVAESSPGHRPWPGTSCVERSIH
jgi:hypothetical protein